MSSIVKTSPLLRPFQRASLAGVGTQQCCALPGAVHKAPHALHQALSGGKPTSATASMPTVPKPSASLLTETQQRANGATEKVLRAVTDNASQAAKLRAVRVCLSAAACHLEQAARTPPHATSRDRAR